MNTKKHTRFKMINNLKLISVIITILLILTLVSPIFTEISYAQNVSVLSGVTYINMPEKVFGGKTTDCKLIITDFNIKTNKFTLRATLSYLGRSYPLYIQGKLYRSRIGKDNFVALAKDTTNNFNVLHFSILFNPSKHFLFTKDIKTLVSKQSDAEFNRCFPIITIYLQRKNTREISFVEGTAIKLSNVMEIHQDHIVSDTISPSIFRGIYNNGPFGVDIFFQKFLQPSKIVNSESIIEPKDSSGYKDIKKYKVYEENYSADGYNVTLHIEYFIELEGIGTYSAQQQDIEEIKVLQNYTKTNSYGSSEILYNEPFSMGKPGDPVRLTNELITPEPDDAIQEYILKQYGANYGSSYLPSIAFSIDTPIGIEINLIRSESPGNELFDLTESEIEGQYNGEAFKTNLSCKGYWLSAPGSRYVENLTFALCGNPTSEIGYRYLYVTVPIYMTHYNGFGVTFSYCTTYGDSLYFQYSRKE